jgi:hypothetical protein
VLDKRGSASKDDRGVVGVETVGDTQDGTVVCTFRRTVLVPKRIYLDAAVATTPGTRRRGADSRDRPTANGRVARDDRTLTSRRRRGTVEE